MPDPEEEALRLARQREADLHAITNRELDRARAQGRKDAEDEASRVDAARHFAAINGSIAKTAEELRGVQERLSRIEGAMATDDAVHAALVHLSERAGSARLTRWQAIGLAVLAGAAIGGFVVSIVTLLGG